MTVAMKQANTKDQLDVAATSNILSVVPARTESFSLSIVPERYRPGVEFALSQAGANRAELERAIMNFQSEPEKLAAVCYLVAGTPFHNFVQSSGTFYRPAQTETSTTFRDCETITADALTNQVNAAFDIRSNYAWAADLDWDTFCQTILPYRARQEPVAGISYPGARSVLANALDPSVADNAHFTDTMYNVINDPSLFSQYFQNTNYDEFQSTIDRYLTEYQNATTPEGKEMALKRAVYYINTIVLWEQEGIHWTYEGFVGSQDKNPLETMIVNYGRCEELDILSKAVMNAVGLPVLSTSVPFWAYISDNHTFLEIVDAQGEPIFHVNSVDPPGYWKNLAGNPIPAPPAEVQEGQPAPVNWREVAISNINQYGRAIPPEYTPELEALAVDPPMDATIFNIYVTPIMTKHVSHIFLNIDTLNEILRDPQARAALETGLGSEKSPVVNAILDRLTYSDTTASYAPLPAELNVQTSVQNSAVALNVWNYGEIRPIFYAATDEAGRVSFGTVNRGRDPDNITYYLSTTTPDAEGNSTRVYLGSPFSINADGTLREYSGESQANQSYDVTVQRTGLMEPNTEYVLMVFTPDAAGTAKPFVEKARVTTDENGAIVLAGLQTGAVYVLSKPTEDGSLDAVTRAFRINEDGSGIYTP